MNLIQAVTIIISLLLVTFIEFGEADAQEQNSVTNDTNALMVTGPTLQTQGKYNESIGYYDKVLAIDPSHADELYSKGTTLDDLGQFEEAIRYYDKVLQIDPNNTDALDNKQLAIENLR